jgi:hypothetical protein
VLDRGKPEIISELLGKIDRLCGWRRHLDDNHRIGRSDRLARQSWPAIDQCIRLVVSVRIDLHGDAVAQRLTWQRGIPDGPVER